MMFLKVISKLLITLPLVLTIGCLKTADQLQQEKEQASHLKESQKMLAELMLRTKDLEEKVSQVSGGYEEFKKDENAASFQQDEIDELRVQVEANQKNLKSIKRELREQKKFIKQLTKTLGKISGAL